MEALVSALGWIGLGWSCWALTRAVRLGRQYLTSRRLRARAQPPSRLVIEVFTTARDRLDNDVEAEIGVTSSVTVPQVVGWRRPMVVLPLHLEATVDRAQLESIILHELVHIKRRDSWVNLGQCAVEALVPHPVVGWVSNRLRVEREFCCDEWVVELGAGSRNYAQALGRLALMEQRRSDSFPQRTVEPSWNA